MLMLFAMTRTMTEILMQHLQILQDNAARTILDLPKYFSGSEALVKLCWTPIARRRRFHRCVAIYKYLNNHISSDLSLIRNGDMYTYKTRRCIICTSPVRAPTGENIALFTMQLATGIIFISK